MSRPPRLEFAGALWHVTSRGNEKRDVFRDDADRELFLSILGRTVELFRWTLHAYVLMENHFHLLVETPEPTLSRGMRQLNGLYTQAFNRRHRRNGHLFRGRFKSVLVHKETHFLELARHVVRNPVRAGAARSARSWAWSSYRATAGLVAAPAWLETSATLRRFGAKRAASGEAYRRFIADGKSAGYEPWEQVREQVCLGPQEFLEEAERRAAKQGGGETARRPRLARTSSLSERIEEAAERLGVPLEEMKRHPRWHIRERRLLAWDVRQRGLFRLSQIGEALGVEAAQVSVLVRGGEALAASGDRLARRLLAGRPL
ncbi:MAG: transposase [Thermoanaerobaculia bacterium]